VKKKKKKNVKHEMTENEERKKGTGALRRRSKMPLCKRFQKTSKKNGVEQSSAERRGGKKRGGKKGGKKKF